MYVSVENDFMFWPLGTEAKNGHGLIIWLSRYNKGCFVMITN